jgi:hypothetical protein
MIRFIYLITALLFFFSDKAFAKELYLYCENYDQKKGMNINLYINTIGGFGKMQGHDVKVRVSESYYILEKFEKKQSLTLNILIRVDRYSGGFDGIWQLKGGSAGDHEMYFNGQCKKKGEKKF